MSWILFKLQLVCAGYRRVDRGLPGIRVLRSAGVCARHHFPNQTKLYPNKTKLFPNQTKLLPNLFLSKPTLSNQAKSKYFQTKLFPNQTLSRPNSFQTKPNQNISKPNFFPNQTLSKPSQIKIFPNQNLSKPNRLVVKPKLEGQQGCTYYTYFQRQQIQYKKKLET